MLLGREVMSHKELFLQTLMVPWKVSPICKQYGGIGLRESRIRYIMNLVNKPQVSKLNFFLSRKVLRWGLLPLLQASSLSSKPPPLPLSRELTVILSVSTNLFKATKQRQCIFLWSQFTERFREVKHFFILKAMMYNEVE